MGLPDTDVFKIININIDSKEAEVAKNKECHTNMKAVQGFHIEQEKDRRWKCYINTDSISKFGNNSKKLKVKTNPNKQTKCFFAGPSSESNKRKGDESTQQIHKEFEDVFNGIGCLEGTFSLQPKSNSKPYQELP